ncbi:MAG: NAD(P)H-hydrate epimerase [Planctomycetota bacterium]|jgi:hydroxyethylthiazole kinase-like uncharacterized protein yjeF|nr:NAD(P)H-hydrate epimerase [Planctomycetota bacterium]MDP6941490.1 NAD(P)H-hydrate epimerase [Planctomycetota bacterium]
MSHSIGWTQREASDFDSFLQTSCGLSASLLMENAGKAAADFVLTHCGKISYETVVALAGPGNNGGDALVAARHLFPELPVIIWAPLGPPKGSKGPALDAWATCQGIGVPSSKGLKPLPLLSPSTLVLDGLFGIGLARSIQGPAKQAIQAISSSQAKVLALDIPSGLDTDSGHVHGVGLPAHWTLSFVGPKRGFFCQDGPLLCGQTHTANIGVSLAFSEAWLAQRREGKQT